MSQSAESDSFHMAESTWISTGLQGEVEECTCKTLECSHDASRDFDFDPAGSTSLPVLSQRISALAVNYLSWHLFPF